MGRRAFRGLMALGVLMALVITTVAPAYAGTLTAASFAATGPYSYTGAQNTRYDWGFTTATTNSLGSVTATVPPGTTGTSPYLWTANDNAGSGCASTPSTAANSITGDLDLRAKMQMPSWTPVSNQGILAKWDAGTTKDLSWSFALMSTGNLALGISTDGTTSFSIASTLATGLSANTTSWVRVTFKANNGAGGNTTTFYTSSDGTTWAPLGSAVTVGGVFVMHANTIPVFVGGWTYNGNIGAEVTGSRFYYAEVRNGIGGTVVDKMDATQALPNAASWTASTGELWTVNRSGVYGADIQADLAVISVNGIPAGGTAAIRYIDGDARYSFGAAGVNAGTPSTLSLAGFINTITAGSYSSVITSRTGATTPLLSDQVTTAAIAFSNPGSNSTASVTVDPSFTFTVGNQAAACNGESNFISGAGTATAIALGHLSAGANASGGQALAVTSNAGGGFSLYIRGTQSSQNLRSVSHNWSDVAGSYASPAALGAGEQFGYTYHDATAGTSVLNPASANFAALTATNQAVMVSTTAMSGTGCVSFDVQSAAISPAGSYSATVIYVAVPTY